MDETPEPGGFSLFATGIGTMGIAWNDQGITRVLLPDRSDDRLREHVCRRHPSFVERTPRGESARAVDSIRRLLLGERVDLSQVRIDETHLSDFQRRVYAVTRRVAPGETLSYGAVAERVGEPGAAQAVGRALGANPVPIIVPCHRVVGARGALVGFSAPDGVALKRLLLDIESRQGSLFTG